MLKLTPLELQNYTPNMILEQGQLPNTLVLIDHLKGFDIHGHNEVLDDVDRQAREAGVCLRTVTNYIPDEDLVVRYPNLRLAHHLNGYTWDPIKNYGQHPEVRFENFICNFNGTNYISRELLVAALHKFGWFNPEYCSKNFTSNQDTLDDYIQQYTGNDAIIYRKFFIGEDSQKFFGSIINHGRNMELKYQHGENIQNLDSKITRSFVNVISETLGESYYPFYTEKLIFSLATRGLFVAMAQPGWHRHLEKYFGFKKYKIFDYRFDDIANPVERAVELISMLYKFSNLSTSDWQDLYLMELDTIEFNYHHFMSGNYRKCLREHCTVLLDNDLK